MNKSRNSERSSSGCVKTTAELLHILGLSEKSKKDHLVSKLVAEAETKIAQSMPKGVNLESSGPKFSSLGFGDFWFRDGTLVEDEDALKKWRKKRMKRYGHYYSQTKEGRWKRRKSKGYWLKKETITLYPEHDYILQALDKNGVDLRDFTKKLAFHLAYAWDKMDRNENVLALTVHPNGGCIHIHLLTTRYVDPTPKLDKITLKNQNTKQGNNRSSHAKPALIAMLRLREAGFWPDQLSENLDSFLRKREKANERLPVDYLVSDIADRYLEEKLPSLCKGKPALEKAVQTAKNEYHQHATLLAAKRLREYLLETGELPDDETLEKLKKAKDKREKAEAKLAVLEKENKEQEKSRSELDGRSLKLSKEVETLEQFEKDKEKHLKSLRETKLEAIKLGTEYKKLVELKNAKTEDICQQQRDLRKTHEKALQLKNLYGTLEEVIESAESLEGLVHHTLEDNKAHGQLSLEDYKIRYLKLVAELEDRTAEYREMLKQGFLTLENLEPTMPSETLEKDISETSKKDKGLGYE